jgi:hypothetical protein
MGSIFALSQKEFPIALAKLPILADLGSYGGLIASIQVCPLLADLIAILLFRFEKT